MSTWLAAMAGGVATPLVVAGLLYGLRSFLRWRVRKRGELRKSIQASLLRRDDTP